MHDYVFERVIPNRASNYRQLAVSFACARRLRARLHCVSVTFRYDAVPFTAKKLPLMEFSVERCKHLAFTCG